MNIEEIRKLVEIIKENDLTEFELDEESFSIRIRRSSEEFAPVVPTIPSSQPIPQPQAVSPEVQPTLVSNGGGSIIESPMVGTFYRAPSPDSPLFVSEGQTVSHDSIVCIIEAMKVMNEIQADISGRIVEVLVDDGDAVEFGQPLFRVQKQ